MMENPFTAQVAQFIAQSDWQRVPAHTHDTAKRLIFDNLSVTIAGSRSEAGRIIQQYAKEMGGQTEAPILGTDARSPVPLASLANGVAAHADDYDDTQIASLPDRVTGLLTHPSTPVFAAALSAAISKGSSGQELLAAYEIGLEVACKIAEAINPEHYQRGFHSTGTIGAFGAFAAVAKILHLKEVEAIRGIGIVASLASGLRGNFGTMTKPLHAGRAAENGVLAARLAQKGFTATPDILDSRWGFFTILGNGFDQKYLATRLGNPFQLESPGVSIKPYPCGSLGHPTMDAVRELVLDQDLRPEGIERIDVGVTQHIRNPLRYQRPRTGLEAKFSLEFGVTMMTLKRKAGIHQYTDETAMSSEVQEFLPRVNCYVDAEMEARGFNKMQSVVRIHLRNGSSLVKEASVARGYPERPFSEEDHLAKFEECAAGVLPAGLSKTVWESVMKLEKLPKAEEIAHRLVL